jgi:DNA-binding beta-propeller fold protein YncE
MWQIQRSIAIPPQTPSEFDHGDVHQTSGRVFVAHTQAGTVEVLDGEHGVHHATIPGCAEASGVLVAQEADVVFAAARGAGKILVIDALSLTVQREIAVDPRPNGLAWDATHGHLLVADVRQNTARLVTLAGETLAVTPLPGRPRWCMFDAERGRFLVNIRDPACVQLLAAETAQPLAQWPVGDIGPHGLALTQSSALVACDGGQCIALDVLTGQETGRVTIAGTPDVIWYNAQLGQAYIAIGDPGVIEVVDVPTLRVIQTLSTEMGAHTTAFDPARQWLYAFLPTTCRADVFVNTPKEISR